jgi:hypothetical protein
VSRFSSTSGYLKNQSEMTDLGSFVQHLKPPKGFGLHAVDALLELFSWRIRVGYRAWIRTMNNASKGRCVTVTPRGKEQSVT